MPAKMLKKISAAREAKEIAYLLKKHLGENPSQIACKEAYEAILQRVRGEPSELAQVMLNINYNGEDNYCEAVMETIAHLESL